MIKSINRLKINQISICLLHNANDMIMYGDNVIRSLIRIRDEGLVKMIGVSTYEPKEVSIFLTINEFDVIQIPINIFDNRIIREGLLDELHKKKTLIFARSVFLQGLFFLDIKNLPLKIRFAGASLRRLRDLSSDLDIPIPKLALTFVRDLPGITSIIIGVETSSQLKKNITFMKSSPLPDEVRKAIFKTFENTNEKILDPRAWETVSSK